MLKIIELSDKSASSKNNSSRSASNKNNNNKSASGSNNGNGKVDGFDISWNNKKHPKKSGKLFKLGKKLSKSRNSTNFGITEIELKFLILDVKTVFNRLWLVFIEAPIF